MSVRPVGCCARHVSSLPCCVSCSTEPLEEIEKKIERIKEKKNYMLLSFAWTENIRSHMSPCRRFLLVAAVGAKERDSAPVRDTMQRKERKMPKRYDQESESAPRAECFSPPGERPIVVLWLTAIATKVVSQLRSDVKSGEMA